MTSIEQLSDLCCLGDESIKISQAINWLQLVERKVALEIDKHP
jgi:hypothetical protein